jgi:phage-related protein
MLDVVILHQCEAELRSLPEDLRADLLDAVARLRAGVKLSMPLSRPMPSIGRAVHELRLRGRGGSFRVIYLIKTDEAIYLVHAFKKSSQKTSPKNIWVASQRMRLL